MPLLVGLIVLAVAATSGNVAQMLVGGLLTVVFLLMLAIVLRAGIGVTDEGVLVRSALGLRRWASWSEIDHFEIVRAPFQKGSGNGRCIAVMLIDRHPLVTYACSYFPWDKWTESNSKVLQDLLDALEDERTAASRPLSGATDADLS